MSLNTIPIKVYKVIDPRLDIGTPKSYVAMKSSDTSTFRQFNSAVVNTTNINIPCDPPSRSHAISTYVLLSVSFEAVLASVGTSNVIDVSLGNLAPRAFPLMSVIESMSITIENDTVTMAPYSEIWHPMLWYNNEFMNRFVKSSTTATMLDQFQEYSNSQPNNRNPLAEYKENSYEQTRGGFVGFEIISNAVGAATVRVRVMEPIMIPPFNFWIGSDYMPCLIGVGSMTFNAVFTSSLSRILSFFNNTGNTSTSVNSVSLLSSSINFQYFAPDPTQSIPSQISYPYYDAQLYVTQTNVSVASGSSVDIIMSNVQLQSIPRRIYISVGRDRSTKTAETTDTYFRLNSITFYWNNKNFLSEATREDLYNICSKNGYQGSFTQWSKFVGSVLCIDMGTDIGLMPDEAPGLIGSYNLYMRLNVTNMSVSAITPSLNVVAISEGIFNIIEGATNHVRGVLRKEDILNSVQDPNIKFKPPTTVWGGDFFSSIKDFFSKVGNIAKKVLPIAETVAPFLGPEALLATKAARSLTGSGKLRKKKIRELRGSGFSRSSMEKDRKNLEILLEGEF